MFKIVEKDDPLAVHCICDTLERANFWITCKTVEYCAKGYFVDKTLTPFSFVIVEVSNAKQ
jgi:hypothetical protein